MTSTGAGRFSSELDTRHVRAGRKVLTAPLVYTSKDGRTFTVPAGFFSDGASVPRPLWVFYPPFGGDYEPAAWLHDYLYAYAELEKGSDRGHISRGEADDLFGEAMEAKSFRRSGRLVVYSGVRVGGWRSWGKYRKAAKEKALDEAVVRA